MKRDIFPCVFTLMNTKSYIKRACVVLVEAVAIIVEGTIILVIVINMWYCYYKYTYCFVKVSV